jgi:hypothetical protein
MNRSHKNWLVALFAACLMAGGAVWAALDSATSKTDLAVCVPQGALLSLETQDFSALLGDWTSSPEKTAWMKSDNYEVFSRSRLFGRLQDAQADFADAAGLPVDSDLLKEMAGQQSFFAWYDIGELQMVYITRMTPAQVSQSRLWKRRKNFETRQAGGVTFYIKTSEDDGSDAGDPNESQPTADDSTGSYSNESSSRSKKTVAFAESGDWLILATGEELMAETLQLMAMKDHPGEDSLAMQSWYKNARAAVTGPEGTLRMVLNMEKVVKTPQFRTYWIQQNVTEMKQYKAVVADLYRDADGMREERVLLPESESAVPVDVDLGQIATIAPEHTAVFRVTAKPTASDALALLQTKVLDRNVGSYVDTTLAPVVDLDAPQAGSVADLESRIDEPVVVSAEKRGTASPLAKLLEASALEGMMSVDRNSADGKAEGIWTPFASAVVLSSTQDWDVRALQEAVEQTVQTNLTVGSLGTGWQQRTSHGLTYYATNEAHGLQLYVRGHTCIVADDEPLLEEMIQREALVKSLKARPAMMVAGFDHDAARTGFTQWTAVVDGLSSKKVAFAASAPAGIAEEQDAGAPPAFFGTNLKGLSDTFSAMKQERFIAWHDGGHVRQTVTYTWQR